MKENRHAAKRSLLVEKQKDFSIKNVLIGSLQKTSWNEDKCVARSIELQNSVVAKLKGDFLVLLWVALSISLVTLSS